MYTVDIYNLLFQTLSQLVYFRFPIADSIGSLVFPHSGTEIQLVYLFTTFHLHLFTGKIITIIIGILYIYYEFFSVDILPFCFW